MPNRPNGNSGLARSKGARIQIGLMSGIGANVKKRKKSKGPAMENMTVTPNVTEANPVPAVPPVNVVPPVPDKPFVARVVNLSSARALTEGTDDDPAPMSRVDTAKGKDKVSFVATKELRFLGEANPRVDFSGRNALKASLVIDGQKEELTIRPLTGEALLYVNRLNFGSDKSKFYPEGTNFVIRGNRRGLSIGELLADAEAAKDEAEIKRWGVVKAIVRDPISDVRHLVADIQDQIGRKPLNLRIEVARAVKQLRDAGYTLKAIAELQNPARSIPWVQDQLRIFDLPNNSDDGFIQDSIREFDVQSARVASGEIAKLPEGAIEWSNEAVRKLGDSFAVHVLKSKKADEFKSPPEDFGTLRDRILKDHGLKRPEKEKDVTRARIAEVRKHCGLIYSGHNRNLAFAVLDSLTAANLDDLNAFKDVKPTK